MKPKHNERHGAVLAKRCFVQVCTKRVALPATPLLGDSLKMPLNVIV